MRRLLLVVFITIFVSILNIYSQSVFRTYEVKFLIDEKGYAYPQNATLIINADEILYTKNSITKNWYMSDKGIAYDDRGNGVKFKLHKFYLYNQKVDAYISYKKDTKHDGVFYYRFIIDGQTQLVL